MRKTTRRDALLALVLVAAFAIAPAFYGNHLLLFNFVVYLALTQGLNIIYGFTGYLPFGYVGFFGAGAYGFAIAVLHGHVPPAIAFAAGAFAAVVLGVILVPLLRLSGTYFAIANLAAAQALAVVVSNPSLMELTRGPYGVNLAAVYAPAMSYTAALVTLAIALGVVVSLRSSHFGLALQAIREDPISAAMSGIDVSRSRGIAWLLSALVAGMCGASFAWYVSVFYPETVFDLSVTIFATVFLLFGGTATLLGPIVGVLVLYGLYNAIGITAPAYFQLAYGVLIVVLIVFLPNGLLALLGRRPARAAGAD